MPRKEGPPLEERMQRAKELFEFKQRQKEKNLQNLYASRIYKFARKTSIIFLWISQIILIDWALPYREEHDKVLGVITNSNTIAMPNKELFIKTEKGYNFKVELPGSTQRPGLGDSVVIYKSFLFHDFKKIAVPLAKANYLITTALTYRFLAFLLIGIILAVMFIFVKNIEVKFFAWLTFTYTTLGSIFFTYYLIAVLH